MLGNYYLYRHIRLDKNEPFYIGIGTKKSQVKSYESEYSRAFSKQRKNSKIWKLITKKTNYRVDILLESNDYNFIKEKEIEFIKLYGRINLDTGILANMTDGGDGTLGWIPTEENRYNMKLSSLKKDYSDHGFKTYQYDLKGEFIKEWKSITFAANSINADKSTLSKTIKKNMNNGFCRGYFWTNYLTDKVEPRIHKNSFWGKVEMLDIVTNQIIKIFNSKEDAVRFLKAPKSSSCIKRAIRTNRTAFGYKWKEVSECHV